MYTKIAGLLIIFTAFCCNICFSQKNPSLQISIGPAIPANELRGNFISTNDSGISFIDTNFIKNEYSISTGITISGSLKFPLEGKGVWNGIFMGSYTFFNAFTKSILGTTIENNIVVPANFDKRFSSTTFGFGIELSPLPQSKISPFINANLTLNILSLSVAKNDFSFASFNDAFRIGVLTQTGVQINLDHEYSLLITGSYHLGNLLLKSHSESLSDRLEFNRDNLPINDDEGAFYTNLSNPNLFPSLVKGKTKNMNWWGIQVGVNIMLGKTGKKK